MTLNEIVKDYLVEDLNHECKARLNKDDVFDWLKTIDGFANEKGGVLYLGVEDKSNKLIGYDLKELDHEKLYLYQTIKAHFATQPLLYTEIISYFIHDKERYILKVIVNESNVKPVIFKYKDLPMIFIRKDGYTSSATVEDIINMSLHSSLPKYDMDYTDVTFNISDFTDLSNFYKKNTNKELKEKELAAISFFDDKNLLRKGALLFKDNYSGEDTTVVCSIFKGFTRGDNQIIASNTFKGNLIRCLDYIITFVEQRTNHGFIKLDDKRIDVDAYPKRSIFEAVVNSLAHRDYFISGSAIYVDLFINRLVITSPGGLYKGDSVKKTYNLKSFISKRRNELISNVFVLCHAMEAKGTGFEKIVDDYKDYNETHKPFIFTKNNQFSIVLPDLTYEQGVDMDTESISLSSPINDSSRFDLSILAFTYSEAKTVKEISSHLKLSNSTFLRNKIIKNLINQNFLIEKDVKNAKTYICNRELVKIL